MKNNLSLFFFFFWSTYLIAQIQIGMVREQNSNKRPLGTVQVAFDGAVPTTSGDDGIFRLVFQGKKAGELIFFNEIKKNGYELVNGKELEILKISSTNRLAEDIILAKSGVLENAKKEYYGISDRALLAGFEKEKKALREKLQKSLVNQQQYADQLTALQEQYGLQKQNLDALAEQFSRVNFDDVDSLYRKAFELFKSGEIEACKKKLENANLIGRTNLRLQERTRIVGAEKAIAKQKADNEKGIQDDIKALRLQTQTYLLTFEFAKAELLYDQLLQLDSTNLGILVETADFYREQHRYAKALRLYPKIIAHPEAQKWQIADAYRDLGDLFTITGNLTDALLAFEQYSKGSQDLLFRVDSNSFTFKGNLAVSYSKLGDTYFFLGDVDKALKLYKDNLTLAKELHDAYPDNEVLKINWSIAIERLGSTYKSLGNFDEALKYYEDYLIISKELFHTYPKTIILKKGLAVAHEKLGSIYLALGNFDKALQFYEEDLKLTRELFNSYPNTVDFKYGLSIILEFLGKIHTQLGALDKSLKFYEEDLKLVKELHQDFPNNVDFTYQLVSTYEQLGITFSRLGDLDKALLFYKDFAKLIKELYYNTPNNVNFKSGVSIANVKLGDTYTKLDSLDKALLCYEESLKLSKELFESNPDVKGNKNGLAIALWNFGVFFRDKQQDIEKARPYLEQSKTLWTELTRSFPQFQSNLKMVQDALIELDDPIFLIKIRIQNEPDTLIQYQLYKTLCDSIRMKLVLNPEYKSNLADALNTRAWLGFFLKKFAEVEADIREAMALHTDNKYLMTNLAPALLLQGKQKAAIAEYQKWKDKPFEEVGLTTYKAAFLDDLNAFEKAGIIPKNRLGDVAAIRKLLMGK